MNSTSDDPDKLLTEEGQWTEPWGASRDNDCCDKCKGQGRVLHECWSCLLGVRKEDCPCCGGEVRWEDDCPVCHGDGRIDGQPRHGVSVFPTVEGLYHYMLDKQTDLDGCTIVELDAVKARDVDFDADQGAMLVIPVAILASHPVDPELAEQVRRRSALRQDQG